jgi:two-component system cell cycle sensor histidine kinase/response regulator CckA
MAGMPALTFEAGAATDVPAIAERLLGPWAGSASPVYCRNVHGHIIAANPAFGRRFGRSSQSFSGRTVADFIHRDDAPALLASDAELRRGPAQTEHQSRWRTPQGWRWFSWEESLIPDGPGAGGVCAVGHDITRLRLAEEQTYKLSRAVEQSPVAMVITDPEGRVQYVNAKYTESTGQTLEGILDANTDVLQALFPNEASARAFWETVRAGGEWRGEHIHERADGKKVWESVQVSALRNSSGEITHLLCLREDISSRRELEDQLRQAQKMESIGTLAGGIAHDFNNLIAVINGYAEFAELSPADPATVRKSMHEIRKAAQRASGLVRQILTFSRKTEVRFSAVDLNQLARDLTALLGETFPRNVSFQFSLEGQLPHLHADQNQLQQVILNFCVNARDAMPGGGTITVATARADRTKLPPGLKAGRDYARLTVSDTGTGMSPEVRARIFEPFFTTKPVNQGTGLGLSVVYGIVASHEGTIQVESQPGQGSSFHVFLPLTDTRASAAASTRSDEFPGGTESILVVEDEAPLRLLIEATLRQKGYRVEGVADGLEAISRLTAPGAQFDAILLDLNMPGASGLDVFRVIRATRPNQKVMVVTGHLHQSVSAEFEALGQHHFLAKPYTLTELGRRLRQLLDSGEGRPRA